MGERHARQMETYNIQNCNVKFKARRLRSRLATDCNSSEQSYAQCSDIGRNSMLQDARKTASYSPSANAASGNHDNYIGGVNQRWPAHSGDLEQSWRQLHCTFPCTRHACAVLAFQEAIRSHLINMLNLGVTLLVGRLLSSAIAAAVQRCHCHLLRTWAVSEA